MPANSSKRQGRVGQDASGSEDAAARDGGTEKGYNKYPGIDYACTI